MREDVVRDVGELHTARIMMMLPLAQMASTGLLLDIMTDCNGVPPPLNQQLQCPLAALPVLLLVVRTVSQWHLLLDGLALIFNLNCPVGWILVDLSHVEVLLD